MGKNVEMQAFHDLKDKTFIITGGAGASAGGTGKALTRKLISLGAKVAVWDIADEAGKNLCDEIQEKERIAFIHCDITESAEVKKALEETLNRFSSLDGLVNNAFWHADVQPPLHELTEDDWDAHMNINLRGHFLVCKAVIPELLKKESSVILNIGSTGAHRGEDGYFAYSAAKAGLESLTRNIAAQYGRQGLRCNCLTPGLILSEESEKLLFGIEAVKTVFEKMDSSALLANGHTTGEKVADSALFFLSELSGHITAQTLVSDCGTISHCPQWADLRNNQ